MKVEPPPAKVRLTIEAVLHASEDPEKVKRAIKNIIGVTEITVTKSGGASLTAETEEPKGLYTVYERIRARQTIGVARRLLTKNASEDSTWIYFNRQAAYVKTVIICADESESALGPIKLTIHTEAPEKVIDWLAPQHG